MPKDIQCHCPRCGCVWFDVQYYEDEVVPCPDCGGNARFEYEETEDAR